MMIGLFEDKKTYDCYTRENFGIFVPLLDNKCEFLSKYEYPFYEIVINFNDISDVPQHYKAIITSPNVIHTRKRCCNCYIILIDKDYFENRYLMYSNEIKYYNKYPFDFCKDILKALNMFIFEYSKSMMNSEITLEAQTEIITHWIIRSIFGETMDMRTVSSDYLIARVQQYIEQNYMETLTVRKLSKIVCVSEATLNRRFKKELGITPIEYLIEIRINKAKTLLKRVDIPILEIALNCGFGSASHFSSCFYGRVNTTPQEYRKRFT